MDTFNAEVALIKQANVDRYSGLYNFAATVICFGVLLNFAFLFEVFVWITWAPKMPLGQRFFKTRLRIGLVWIAGLTFYGLFMTLVGGAVGWIIFNASLLIFVSITFFMYLHSFIKRKKGKIDDESDNFKIDLFNKYPEGFDKNQLTILIVAIICWLICTLIVIGVSTIPFKNYLVLERETNTSIIEIKPGVSDKFFTFTYILPGFVTVQRMNIFWIPVTTYCGVHNNILLTTDAEKRVYILQDWIETYNINMTIFARPYYYQYNSSNDWFTRTLAPGVRPIDPNPKSIVSGADCRITVFNNVPSTLEFWIKGDYLTLNDLFQNQYYANMFEGGELAIFRLAPQDYHHIHAPVDGVIIDYYDLDGEVQSVNSDAVRSDNHVLEKNKKSVYIVNSNTTNSTVALIPIGATCVASLVIHPGIGDSISRGEDMGYFQFGGSTVVVIFQKGSVTWDSDLLEATGNQVEVLVNVRTHIGVSNT